MNGRNEENLKDLFEKFLDPEQAENAAKDIREGEQILSRRPEPRPDGELVARIKSDIARALLVRKRDASWRTAYKAAAVAAAIILAAVMSVKLPQTGPTDSEQIAYASIIPAAVWDSNNLDADDADLATLNAEIKQIEGELLALQLGENGTNGSSDVTELEMELIEIDSDFWKG